MERVLKENLSTTLSTPKSHIYGLFGGVGGERGRGVGEVKERGRERKTKEGEGGGRRGGGRNGRREREVQGGCLG